jgi:hypothetical protein
MESEWAKSEWLSEQANQNGKYEKQPARGSTRGRGMGGLIRERLCWRIRAETKQFRPMGLVRARFSLLLLCSSQYEPTCQCGGFSILSPWRANCPPQFEQSTMDSFEGEANLGGPTAQCFALLYTGYRQPTGLVRPSDCLPKEFALCGVNHWV